MIIDYLSPVPTLPNQMTASRPFRSLNVTHRQTSRRLQWVRRKEVGVPKSSEKFVNMSKRKKSVALIDSDSEGSDSVADSDEVLVISSINDGINLCHMKSSPL